MSDNNITIVGNLTRDPELRFTAGGQAVAGFGIAVNRRWQKDGEWQEEVAFFNVTAWGALAENTAQSCTKGNRIVVSGRLGQSSYEDKEGKTVTKIEITADEIGASMKYATVEISRIERDKS